MTPLEIWAEECKRKTDAGAVMLINGEIWENVQWQIDDIIEIRSGNHTLIFREGPFDPHNEAIVVKELRANARFLVNIGD